MVYPQSPESIVCGKVGYTGEALPPTRPWDVHIPEMVPWSGRQDSPPVVTFLRFHLGACSRPANWPKAKGGLGGGFLVASPLQSLQSGTREGSEVLTLMSWEEEVGLGMQGAAGVGQPVSSGEP